MSRDTDDRVNPDGHGRYFRPFDAERSLLSGCSCGADHDPSQHVDQASNAPGLLSARLDADPANAFARPIAQVSPENDTERLSGEFIAVSYTHLTLPTKRIV